MKNKKIFYAVMVFSFAAFLAGCSGLKQPTVPGTNNNNPTPTFTATPTATSAVPDMQAVVVLERVENTGLFGEQFAAYVTDPAGVTLTTAAITLIGPGGIISTPVTSGIFLYQNMGTAADFVFGGQYALSVTINAVNYYGTFTNDGDITVAADGSQVSWPFQADQVMIALYTPSMSMQAYYPTMSPFNITATGLYNAGSGTYMIAPIAIDTIPMTFQTAGMSGMAAMENLKMVQVVK